MIYKSYKRDTKRDKIRKVKEDKEKKGKRKGNCSSFIINMRKDPPFLCLQGVSVPMIESH
jgi:hypothetical protein